MTSNSTDQYDRSVFAELVPHGPRPVIRPSVHTTMFGALAVMIAILPGLYGLTHWDLTPPGPWWGLRGLAIVDDQMWIDQTPMVEAISGRMEYQAVRSVALQPPLFAWAEALLLTGSPSRSPLATVLPSYFGGVALILAIYLQGRKWSKPGTAIVAAWIFAFHVRTLDAMQRAGPATLGAASIVWALQFYSFHILAGQGGRIRGRILYAMGCGACLGFSLMSVGIIGLMIIPVIALHQLALNAGESPLERPRHWYEAWRVMPGLFYGAAALSVALLIAAPWHVWMTMVYQSDFWLNLLEPQRTMGTLNRGPIGHLLDAAPFVLFLSLYAAWFAIRSSIEGNSSAPLDSDRLTRSEWINRRIQDNLNQDQNGLLLWTIWAFVALALCVYWPLGPQNTLGLTLAAPLSLLAANIIRDLSQRAISARILVWLTPLIIFGVIWWTSDQLRLGVRQIQQSGINSIRSLGSNPAIPATLAAMIFSFMFAVILTNWGARKDTRSRFLIGAYLFLILSLQTLLGLNELRFRHNITRQLLDLRESIVRRNLTSKISHIHVVGSITPADLAILRPNLAESTLPNLRSNLPLGPNPTGIDPAGRLRFILHSALPRVPQTDHDSIQTLTPSQQEQRLVILVGTDSRLSISDQSRLSLEPIHPGVSQILTAFATTIRRDSNQTNLPAEPNPSVASHQK